MEHVTDQTTRVSDGAWADGFRSALLFLLEIALGDEIELFASWIVSSEVSSKFDLVLEPPVHPHFNGLLKFHSIPD
jgi:hypothetical protein